MVQKSFEEALRSNSAAERFSLRAVTAQSAYTRIQGDPTIYLFNHGDLERRLDKPNHAGSLFF